MYTITNHAVVHSIKIPKDWNIVFLKIGILFFSGIKIHLFHLLYGG